MNSQEKLQQQAIDLLQIVVELAKVVKVLDFLLLIITSVAGLTQRAINLFEWQAILH